MASEKNTTLVPEIKSFLAEAVLQGQCSSEKLADLLNVKDFEKDDLSFLAISLAADAEIFEKLSVIVLTFSVFVSLVVLASF
eukprot:Awhi_evm1s4353